MVRSCESYVGMSVVLGLSCILPDKNIQFEENITNRYPVRIIEPITLSSEAEESCNEDEVCRNVSPLALDEVLPRFLDPRMSKYDFCTCPEGYRDANAQPAFSIYVDDQDLDEGDKPADILYAALQVDPYESPMNSLKSIAYRNFVNPQIPLQSEGIREYLIPGQPSAILREIKLGDDFTRFDFCNPGDRVLSPGWHILRVIVTDRPWFAPSPTIIQEGTIDLVANASSDTITYTFHCRDGIGGISGSMENLVCDEQGNVVPNPEADPACACISITE